MANEQDLRRYEEVYRVAREIYIERDKIRDGLWKDYSPRDQLVQAKIKIERCLSLMDRGPDGYEEHVLDELPDIINYSIFAHRQLRPQDGEV